MNITRFSSILFPSSNTMRTPSGLPMCTVRNAEGGGYITTADIRMLADMGRIEIVSESDEKSTAAMYGRTTFVYRVVNYDDYAA